MAAALFMALTRSLLVAEAQREMSPRRALQSVNRLLRQLGDPDMFVTVFYGVVDVAARRLTYARAGHEEPFLLREGKATRLGGAGTVLGMLDADELTLAEEGVDLRPSDRLVLYTDGLADALGPGGEPFGLDRLERLLAGAAGMSPADLCATAFAAVAAYQGDAEQFDDMAMLVVGVA